MAIKVTDTAGVQRTLPEVSEAGARIDTKVSEEAARAKAAEEAAVAAVNSEKSNRESEITRVEGLISSEASRAQGVESGHATRISAIEKKIPVQASETNQLADKDFVNSTINSSAAFFRGAYETKAALDQWQTANPGVATNNDYAYVSADETHNNEAWRYIYVDDGETVGWQPQFRVNETPFTEAQLKAINSGITSDLTAKITANETAISEEAARAQAAESDLSDTLDTTRDAVVEVAAKLNKIENGTATVPNASVAAKLGTATKGSTTKPIYLNEGVPAECSRTIPAINMNGSSTTSATFYAPTSPGTAGQVLISNGSGAPSWGIIVFTHTDLTEEDW